MVAHIQVPMAECIPVLVGECIRDRMEVYIQAQAGDFTLAQVVEHIQVREVVCTQAQEEVFIQVQVVVCTQGLIIQVI